MSTYILMKLLESAPERYDMGIRILTLGKIDPAYDRIVSSIINGQDVLDIGCGTGALTLRAARNGARVKGIDINPRMLEIARKRAVEEGLEQNVQFFEMGIAELGGEESDTYDIVMSGLCFSELTEDELKYTLKETKRILKAGGLLLIADEVTPGSISKRILHLLIRIPLLIITYIVTQNTTRAIKNLPEMIAENGFMIKSARLGNLGSFLELAAQKPVEGRP
ncbi:malonyl-[acyl-carrier protein] O-methyltransferase [bacterium BMS3Abin07]|nr:malonyl-[acyl-carrier protein] O-methyltransferase [bacterium BMS3Abin07]GBE31348.1 malonyl-[acyl-carrier protein] O-methyltransferase [bacterium BMS3Bbin05]